MAKVIIYANDSGGISVTVPTGELSIEAVKEKDTPEHSIIVDTSELPQGSDAQFFDAWELNGSTVTVNLDKAKAFSNTVLNNIAKTEVTHRATNTSIGVVNKLSDIAWLNLLDTARTVISSAINTQQLLDALNPVQTTIADNS